MEIKETTKVVKKWCGANWKWLAVGGTAVAVGAVSAVVISKMVKKHKEKQQAEETAEEFYVDIPVEEAEIKLVEDNKADEHTA